MGIYRSEYGGLIISGEENFMHKHEKNVPRETVELTNKERSLMISPYEQAKAQAKLSLSYYVKEIGFLGITEVLYEILRERTTNATIIIHRFQDLANLEMERIKEEENTNEISK